MNTETLGALAEQASDKLVSIHNFVDAGQASLEQFQGAALVVLMQAKVRSVALADLALAAELTRLRGDLVPPLGLGLPEDADTATSQAIEDTLTSPQYALNAAAAVAVLGRAETLAAAQDATSRGMVRSEIEGWTRVLNAGACELCQDLAGEVLPRNAIPYHHKGCGCTIRPVTITETVNTQEEA